MVSAAMVGQTHSATKSRMSAPSQTSSTPGGHLCSRLGGRMMRAVSCVGMMETGNAYAVQASTACSVFSPGCFSGGARCRNQPQRQGLPGWMLSTMFHIRSHSYSSFEVLRTSLLVISFLINLRSSICCHSYLVRSVSTPIPSLLPFDALYTLCPSFNHPVYPLFLTIPINI